MKKEKPTWLVLLVIWFLLLMIVLPPLFRILFPINKKSTTQTTLLNCQTTVITEGYKISSTTNYVNNKATTNTIMYTKYNNNPSNSTTIVASEIKIFSGIPNLNIVTTANTTKIVITKTINKLLPTSYLNTYQKQMNFYQNKGYICKTFTS